jgi:hypothetical protein
VAGGLLEPEWTTDFFTRDNVVDLTADQAALETILPRLFATYGKQIVHHLYSGYCEEHKIPNRAVTST